MGRCCACACARVPGQACVRGVRERAGAGAPRGGVGEAGKEQLAAPGAGASEPRSAPRAPSSGRGAGWCWVADWVQEVAECRGFWPDVGERTRPRWALGTGEPVSAVETRETSQWEMFKVLPKMFPAPVPLVSGLHSSLLSPWGVVLVPVPGWGWAVLAMNRARGTSFSLAFSWITSFILQT